MIPRLFGFLFLTLGLMTSLKAQERIYFVQVGAYNNPEPGNFSSLYALGYVFSEAQTQGLHSVLMGAFDKAEAANRLCLQVRQKGYKHAFVVERQLLQSDAVYVIQLATYRQNEDIPWADWQAFTEGQLWGQLNATHIRLSMGLYADEAQAQTALNSMKQYSNAPKDLSLRRVSRQSIHHIKGFEMHNSAKFRQSLQKGSASVRQLQEFLRRQNPELKADGLWGKASEEALQKAKASSAHYGRYADLAKTHDFGQNPAEYSLQHWINLLGSKPEEAIEGLKQQPHPMARAYTAYAYLSGLVAHPQAETEVNRLMYIALDQVFPFYQLPTRYDFKQRYAYAEMGQFIAHLRALSEAVREEPQFPQWLFHRHPEHCREAFAPYWYNERDYFELAADRGSFFDWEEYRVLLLLARDFAGTEGAAIQLPLGELNRHYALANWLSPEESSALWHWETEVFARLSDWSKGSPFQAQLFETFSLCYYDALRRIETHYRQIGFPADTARDLGLAVLHGSLHPYLKAYLQGAKK